MAEGHSKDAAHFLPEKIPELMTWEQVISVYHISEETLVKNVEQGLRVLRWTPRGKRLIRKSDVDNFLVQKAIADGLDNQYQPRS